MATSEFRIDAQRLDARMRRDQRGMLIVPAFATRTGVFTYTGPDGKTVRDLRHPDDVFSAAHLDSLAHASLTVGHPASHVTPANASALEAGVVLNPRREGSFVAAELSVRRADVIRRVEARELVELSCGYTLDIDPTPGVYEGQRYDQRQRAMRVNHVALCPKGGGRAGPEVRIRADSGAELILRPLVSFTDNIQATQGSGTMDQEAFDEQQEEMLDRFDQAAKKLRRAGHPSSPPTHTWSSTPSIEQMDRSDDDDDDDDDGDNEDGSEREDSDALDAAMKRYRGAR